MLMAQGIHVKGYMLAYWLQHGSRHTSCPVHLWPRAQRQPYKVHTSLHTCIPPYIHSGLGHTGGGGTGTQFSTSPANANASRLTASPTLQGRSGGSNSPVLRCSSSSFNQSAVSPVQHAQGPRSAQALSSSPTCSLQHPPAKPPPPQASTSNGGVQSACTTASHSVSLDPVSLGKRQRELEF